jgi:hypothetical protein
MMSADPPAAKGQMMEMGFMGYLGAFCARLKVERPKKNNSDANVVTIVLEAILMLDVYRVFMSF